MKRYVLPELPYDHAALEPHYSAQLLELHHDKHHAAYVAGANTTVEKLAEAREKNDFAAINQLEKNLAFHVSGHGNRLRPALSSPSFHGQGYSGEEHCR